MKTISTFIKVSVMTGVLGLSVSANAATIYGLNRGTLGGGIYQINPLTGASSLTFTTPSTVGKDGNGLAYDQPSNTFYYVGDGNTPKLYRRNGSGETLMGSLVGGIASAAFLGNAYYYVVQNTNTLRKVVLNNVGIVSNTAVTMKGIKVAGYGDIAFAPDGTLWGASDQQLYKFNLGTGIGTVVKAGLGNLQIGFYNGTLYGVQTATDKVFSVNLGTGALSLTSTLLNGKRLEIQDAAGLVRPEMEVPEPGTVALFVGMGLSGLLTLRRRARK